MGKTFLIAAGGTGGHLFPAESLAAELGRRGHVVDLVTDERADKYGRAFPARTIHIVPSATVKGRGVLAVSKTLMALGRGILASSRIIRRARPAAVIGFGGYPTYPPLRAAQLLGVPTIIHEANAVMGRANRMLAPKATRIALSFPQTGLMHAAHDSKLVHTGNPVRDMVIEAAQIPYDPLHADGVLRLLVFGGSQGARVFSELVPQALGLMTSEERARVHLVQQVRAEDRAGVEAAYGALGFSAELAPFFVDLPTRIAQAHLVLCRSGASTVSELAAIGRPGILVPLPGALDQDQANNARVLEAAGGGWMVPQADLTPTALAARLRALLEDPAPLIPAATAARAQGRADAVKRLADLVETVEG
jgi:UDP-N-acetylglucosamine--N-acetylmuramyl-(pentapeptide) pyrophosphoryl-undecaprenol N-acetylglucosamine transferase